ncbi:PREDICTED: putative serine protease K12H4.7 [Galeopterus variegatus]|uniref:Serine protease K12H4.7 n=1 Tax=Galeopterus variegatus TaxID=482537 RepID=A0ABM0RWR7_GALVR|nr:PREDICTED: putative serine protease K12H4.7 [Galeopterus variegatus]
MIEGETAASRNWMLPTATWVTYAKRLGALCLLLEHRFYGHSQPTGNLSTSSLYYLSSRQALADTVNFRTVIAEEMNLTSNSWVVFGGSYGGCLAVWLRVKYPNLFAAALGSSAPIQAKIDFYEYLEVVQRSLAAHNRECPKVVKEASDIVVEMLKYPKNFTKLTDDFNLCHPLEINSELDRAYFLESLAGFFMDIVQYNKDNVVFEGMVNIDLLCGLMTNASLGSPYDRYVRVIHEILQNERYLCLSASYNQFVENLSDSYWDQKKLRSDRQWVYQTCTEFGYFQTTNSKNQPFSGFRLRLFIQQCSDIFGPEFNGVSMAQAVQSTNEFYGGRNITGSKIIFPNGSIDPWHALGIIKNISEELPAVFMEGESHCADMYPQSQIDSPQLLQAREKIFGILQTWLMQ